MADGGSADSAALPVQVEAARALLRNATRPVLLLGHGVRLADAVDEYRQLAERLQLPVLTTWLGMDLIDAEHPLFCGRPGGMAPRGSNFTVQNADLLLVAGSRLDLGLVGYSYEHFARAARKVIVDIDRAELEKYPIPIDLPVVADAKAFAVELLRQLGDRDPVDRSAWLQRCRDWQRRYPLLTPEQTDPTLPLSAYHFSRTLSDAMTAEDIVAPGSSGFACEIFLLTYRCKRCLLYTSPSPRD